MRSMLFATLPRASNKNFVRNEEDSIREDSSADIRLHCLTKQVEHAVLLSRYIFHRKLSGWRKHFIFSLSFNPALSFCAHARDRYCELAHYASCHCSTVSQLSRQLPPRERLFQPSMALPGFMKLLQFPIHTFLYRFVHPPLFAG